MTTGATIRDLDYHSPTLPRGTFTRSVFDNHLVRLSDLGGASALIGAVWSDVAAKVLDSWVGNSVPDSLPHLAGGIVEQVHRLDTLPGVASRASKAGLKNPDFIIFGQRAGEPVVFSVDAKFSVETARPDQVSASTTAKLFDADEHLTRLLPDPEPGAVYANGVFLSPDYSLTHAMFRHKVGHRRMTISQRDVFLASVGARTLLRGVADSELIERLSGIDALRFDVWDSLLATQYYFRLERAAVGLVADERKPLLGPTEIEATAADVHACLEDRASAATGAWSLIRDWDRDVEQIRRQRQAVQQVIGVPISSAELRDLSDRIMARLAIDPRPSRNRIRKALGRRFMGDVLADTGAIVPPIADFSAELQRVAAVAARTGEHYAANMTGIVQEIIEELAAPTPS